MVEKFASYLQDLVMLPGLSGHEQQVAACMKGVFDRHGFETRIDTFGNCIARLPGRVSGKKLMLFAHMDNLGFFIRYIEEDGFLRLERMGGIPEKVLPSTEIAVQRRDGSLVRGVIGIKQHHVTPPEEKYVVEKLPTLFADIGARNRQEALDEGVNIGSPVMYRPKFQRLRGSRVTASFLDNRTGCASLLLLAELLKGQNQAGDIYLVGTVMEEYNLRGAMMAARTIEPDLAIGIDGGPGGDTPEMPRGPLSLGGGPVISHYNFHGRGTLNGTIPHPAMVRLLEASAEKAGVNIQHSAIVGGLTDASYLQLERKGIPLIDIGAPRRYTHSPSEVADMDDSVNLVRWLLETVKTDLQNFDFSRKE
ncbi:MAG: M20/M25/M40 family metallo-hydrolase [Treponema sp.]|jgi:putative aminopeptidase FrvX|nr:M20/M25/M40 family metallo-hydrolase [Treponema sp.]